ncbi:preprotein translocase subunit SecG [Candidatus Sumerlaeota bacterium]|nr:preprotein translocase subunit SecG [Candidatus Sumerlaeota bacterium]
MTLQTIGFLPLLALFVVFFIICAILIFFILMQKGKGEGLAGLIGGVSAADGMGTPEAQKDLARYTKILSIVFFSMCLLLSIVSSMCGAPTEPDYGGTDEEAPLEATAPTPEDNILDIDITGEDMASPEATAMEPEIEMPVSPEMEMEPVLEIEMPVSPEIVAEPEMETETAVSPEPVPEPMSEVIPEESILPEVSASAATPEA